MVRYGLKYRNRDKINKEIKEEHEYWKSHHWSSGSVIGIIGLIVFFYWFGNRNYQWICNQESFSYWTILDIVYSRCCIGFHFKYYGERRETQRKRKANAQSLRTSFGGSPWFVGFCYLSSLPHLLQKLSLYEFTAPHLIQLNLVFLK